ncbi:uncharacterized protein LOC107272179 [Cephus cinctus]|uniref:Uncharacterized protein LOC107272179 n=1 Tax=Cephus cinctus TaxID=211228 RepID=A0AAJ7C8N9_CEPCN|nr:uncharacterized protein LOC107272179 [Cephus cinctus]
MPKCYVCRAKPGSIKVIDDAKQCKGCGQYYHASCADRAAVNVQGAYVPCCGNGNNTGKVVSQKLNASTSGNSTSGNSTSVTRKQAMKVKATPADTGIGADEEDVESLDPSIKKLWGLIRDKFNPLESKVDGFSESIELVNDKIDVIEIRIDNIEESVSKIDSSALFNEVNERFKREKNFIIFNMSDSINAVKEDLSVVQNLFNQFDDELPFSLSDIKVVRLGIRQELVIGNLLLRVI